MFDMRIVEYSVNGGKKKDNFKRKYAHARLHRSRKEHSILRKNKK